MKTAAENYIIQTVSRALDLLEQFQEGEAELGITDLSNRMHLQKNNVFRLVATLKAKNYIEMNTSTGKYRLGIKSRALGQAATQQNDFANHARPFLLNLNQMCHETCYFSVIRDGYTNYLDSVESDLPVRVVQRIGNSRPLYSTAAGRIQLAFMEPQKQREILYGSDTNGITAGTVTEPDVLLNELKQVAQQGYVIDDQGYDAGVMEIAAPVFDSRGVIIGALSIVGPEMRLAGQRLESELVPLLLQEAARLSADLGYRKTGAAFDEIGKQAPVSFKKSRNRVPKRCADDRRKSYC